MTKKALIVIDIQNDYFPGGKCTLEGIDEASANAAQLISAARNSGDLVVHVRHEFPTSDAPFFAPGTTGAKTHNNVKAADGEAVIVKNQINCFLDTDLKDLLDQNDISQVVICGAMSHMCIDAATRAAKDLGYDCTLVHDACATLDLEFNGVKVPAQSAHAAYMAALGFAYADLTSTKDYLGGTA